MKKKFSVFAGLLLTCLLAPTSALYAVTISVDPSAEFQTISGFGCHNSSRTSPATLVSTISMSAHRDEIIGSSSAVGFDILKQFKDQGVKHFFATPWSPPANLKMNDSLSGENATTNKLKSESYDAMAELLVQYAANFRTQVGTDVELYISPQNEPRFPEPYSSCVYTYIEYINFIKVFGPKLKARFPDVKIAVSEDMLTDWAFYLRYIVQDAAAIEHIDAISVHGYSDGIKPGDQAKSINMWKGLYNFSNGANPLQKKLKTMQTETSGYTDMWENGNMTTWTNETVTDAPGGLALGVDIAYALKFGHVSSWHYWRCDNQRYYKVTDNGVRQASTMYHRYVRPGQINIGCTQTTADAEVVDLAFRDKTDNKLVVVAINIGHAEKTLSVEGPAVPNTFSLIRSSTTEDVKSVGTASSSDVKLAPRSMTVLVGENYNPTIVSVDLSKREFVRSVDRAGTQLYSLDGRRVAATANKLSRTGSVLVDRSGWMGFGKESAR